MPSLHGLSPPTGISFGRLEKVTRSAVDGLGRSLGWLIEGVRSKHWGLAVLRNDIAPSFGPGSPAISDVFWIQ